MNFPLDQNLISTSYSLYSMTKYSIKNLSGLSPSNGVREAFSFLKQSSSSILVILPKNVSFAIVTPHSLVICGEVFCALFCPKYIDKPGNLNRHAKKYHMGASFFLDTQSLDHNLVNAQFHIGIVKRGLYWMM